MNRSPEQRTILAIYSFKAYIKYNKKHLLKYTLIPRSDYFLSACLLSSLQNDCILPNNFFAVLYVNLNLIVLLQTNPMI